MKTLNHVHDLGQRKPQRPQSISLPILTYTHQDWIHIIEHTICFAHTHSFRRHIHWNVSAVAVTALTVWPWQQKFRGPRLVLDPQQLGEEKGQVRNEWKNTYHETVYWKVTLFHILQHQNFKCGNRLKAAENQNWTLNKKEFYNNNSDVVWHLRIPMCQFMEKKWSPIHDIMVKES